jgi:predicted small metal-binding protein
VHDPKTEPVSDRDHASIKGAGASVSEQMRRSEEEGRNPMKEFHCGSLVPGCDWHTRADEEAEVMRRAVEHMRETHGETIIRETMIEAIRSRIEKPRDAA